MILWKRDKIIYSFSGNLTCLMGDTRFPLKLEEKTVECLIERVERGTPFPMTQESYWACIALSKSEPNKAIETLTNRLEKTSSNVYDIVLSFRKIIPFSDKNTLEKIIVQLIKVFHLYLEEQ